MEFDHLLSHYIGNYGCYQKGIVFLLNLSNVFAAIYTISPVFLAAIPDHWCQMQNSLANCSKIDQKRLVIPVEVNNNLERYSRCRKFTLNYTEFFSGGACTRNTSNGTNAMTEDCKNWEYDQSRFTSTMITEWNLVCKKAGSQANILSVYMGGKLLSCFLFGYLADRFGRRKTIIFTCICSCIFGVSSAFSPNYTTLLVLRFFLAICETGYTTVSFALASELVGISRRVLVGCMHMFAWAIGYMLLPSIAYFVRDWRILQLCLSCPEVVLCLIFLFMIPESPRWLLVKGRQAEALKVVKQMARINKTPLPSNVHITVSIEKASVTILDLVRTPSIRLLSLNLFFNWFANSFVYYGLSLHTSDLGGNPYVNCFISGAVELVAYPSILWAFFKFGRLWPKAFCMLVGGVSLFAVIIVPADLVWLSITLAMIGKCLITASFSMAWIYVFEAYPTSIKSIGLNTCSLFAKISGFGASYVGMLGEINRVLPPIIFGTLSIVAGALVMTMPETKGVPLKQTLKDGEEFVRENSCMLCRKTKPLKRETQDEKCIAMIDRTAKQAAI